MASSIPRWKLAIENTVAKHDKSSVIQLATISTSNSSGASHPHIRSHIFRSFLSAQSDPSSPLLVTTTDIRAPKVKQLVDNPNVEVTWWILGSQEQFRISGVARVIPDPRTTEQDVYQSFVDFVRRYTSSDHSDDSGAAGDTTWPGIGMVKLVKEGFDWEAKRLETFNTMNPPMKASFCTPRPGTPFPSGTNPEEESKKWPFKIYPPGSEEGRQLGMSEADVKRYWEMATRNFALVVVEAREVDYLELGVAPNRRTKFWRGEGGKWEEQAVVP